MNKIIKISLLVAIWLACIPLPSQAVVEDIKSPEYVENNSVTDKTEYTQTVVLPTGRFSKTISTQKMHYLARSGQYEKVVSNFQATEDAIFPVENGANDFDIKVGKTINEGISYANQSQRCHFKLEKLFFGGSFVELNTNQIVSFERNKAFYQNIWEEIDLELTLTPEGVITELVVPKGAKRPDQISFQTMDCAEEVFISPTASSQSQVHQVHSRLVETSVPQKSLVLTPDYSLFNDLEEVRIDPSIINSTTKDTFVSSSTLNPANGQRRFLAIGNYTDYTICTAGICPTYLESKALIGFTDIDLPKNAIVDDIQLELWQYGANPNHKTVGVYGLNQSWDETIVWPGPNPEELITTVNFPNYNSNSEGKLVRIPLGETKVRSNYFLANLNVGNGIVVCSKNIPSGPCKSGMEPKIIVNYTLNSPPETPNLVTPENFAKFSGSCDESLNTGTCRAKLSTHFKVNNLRDIDNNFADATLSINGHETHQINLLDHPEANPIVELSDGEYQWNVRSRDTLNLYGDNSFLRDFIIDTTPPGVPIIKNQASWSGLIQGHKQIEIQTNPVEDNLSNQIQYQLKYYAKDSPGIFYFKEWQLSPIFQISGFGGDGMENTEDDLVENRDYHFEVQAKDELGNISQWSQGYITRFDFTSPLITDFTTHLTRFSPSNPSSKNIKDRVNIEAVITDNTKLTSQFSIFTLMGERIYAGELVKDENNLYKSQWNGQDLNNLYVKDGVYIIRVKAIDEAQNESQILFNYIVVDNSSAGLLIDNFQSPKWINSDSYELMGQVAVPNLIDKEDSDIETLTISTEEHTANVVFDSSGFFTYNLPLANDQIEVTFTTTDLVGNQLSIKQQIKKDKILPRIAVLPSTKENVVNFRAMDLESGLDTQNVTISLLSNNSTPIYLVERNLIIQNHLVEEYSCLNSSKNLDCTLQLNYTNLPGGNHSLILELRDIAGNISTHLINFFIYGENAFLVMTPQNGDKFVQEEVIFTGMAPRGTTLIVENRTLNKSASFQINETQEISQISEYVLTPLQTYCINDLCKWEMTLSQQNGANDFRIQFSKLQFSKVEELTINVDPSLLTIRPYITSNIFSPEIPIKNIASEMNFSWEILNKANAFEKIRVKNYRLNVYNDSKQLIYSSLKESNEFQTTWNGKICPDCSYVLDGKYSIEIEAILSPTKSVKSDLLYFQKTSRLDKKILITSPSEIGTTNLAGVQLKGLSQLEGIPSLTLCINNMHTDIECDTLKMIGVVDGRFDEIINLPISKTEPTKFELQLHSYANEGNESSNIVSILFDPQAPFTAKLSPYSVKGNSQSNYQEFLNNKFNIQEINHLAVSLQVPQHTHSAKIVTRSHNFLIQSTSEDKLNLNPAQNPEVKKNLAEEGISDQGTCGNIVCEWKVYIPISPDMIGDQKLEISVQIGASQYKQSLDFIVDHKEVEGGSVLHILTDLHTNPRELYVEQNTFFSNNSHIKIFGYSKPNSNFKLFISDKKSIVKQSKDGFWEVETQVSKRDIEEYCIEMVHQKCHLARIPIYIQNEDMITIENYSLEYDVRPIKLSEVFRSNGWNYSGWAKSGDVLSYSFKSNKPLFNALIRKPDGYKVIADSQNKIHWTSFVNIDQKSEGWYLPEIHLRDLAGNIEVIKSANSKEIFGIRIDNTAPDSPFLELERWGRSAYFDTEISQPRLALRAVGFLTKNDSTEFRTVYEKSQKLQINVNNEGWQSQQLKAEKCEKTNNQKITTDGVIVINGEACLNLYRFSFPENSGWKDLFGIPTEKYSLNFRIVDLAGNISDLSSEIGLFHDKKPPELFFNKTNIGNNSVIAKLNFQQQVLGEPLSKLQTKISKLNNKTEILFEEKILQNSSEVNLAFNYHLKEVSPECITIKGRRRIGFCSDGLYKISSKLSDQAGNITAIEDLTFELDTVAPQPPKVEIVLDRAAHKLKARFRGEENNKLVVREIKQGFQREYNLDSKGNLELEDLIGVYDPNTEYLFTVAEIDSAGNLSEPTLIIKKTPKTAFCYVNGENFLITPVEGNFIISSGGNFLDKRGANPHAAIDFAYATSKQTYGKPVFASADGQVTFAQEGNHYYDTKIPVAGMVILAHPQIALRTEYGHLAKVWVKEGQKVKKGQLIGEIGNTGNVSPRPKTLGDTKGSHLHFAVRAERDFPLNNYQYQYVGNSIYINPMNLLNGKCKGFSEGGNGAIEEFKSQSEEAETSIQQRIAHYSEVSAVGQMNSCNLNGNEVYFKITHGIKVTKENLQNEPEGKYNSNSLEEGELETAFIVYPTALKKSFMLRGWVMEAFLQEGGPCSETLGYVTSEEELANVSKYGAAGQHQWFEKGSIYNSSFNFLYQRGVALHGKVNELFESLGGTQSGFGFPKSHIYDNSCGGKVYFERGEIDACQNIGNPIDINESKLDTVRGEYKSGVDYANLKFRLIPYQNKQFIAQAYEPGRKVWLVIHGFDGNFDERFQNIGKAIHAHFPEALVFGVDWGDIAAGKDLPLSVDNCRVATAAKEIAHQTQLQLKKWGFSDSLHLNLIGHSLGTLVNAEIATAYGYAESMYSLDPPSAANCQTQNKLKGYLVQQNPKVTRGDFINKSFINRSYTGLNSVAADKGLAQTAKEAFSIDYGSTNPAQHSWILDSFYEMNLPRRFENDYISLIDNTELHSTWHPNGENECEKDFYNAICPDLDGFVGKIMAKNRIITKLRVILARKEVEYYVKSEIKK